MVVDLLELDQHQRWTELIRPGLNFIGIKISPRMTCRAWTWYIEPEGDFVVLVFMMINSRKLLADCHWSSESADVRHRVLRGGVRVGVAGEPLGDRRGGPQ